MPDTTFTPTGGAIRRINSSEAELLQSFLTSDNTLDQFIADQGLSRSGVDKALAETGLRLPSRGLGNRFTNQEIKLFTDVLSNDRGFVDSASRFGFDAANAVTSLQEAGLNVPLTPSEQGLFDTAESLGFTSGDVASRLGIDQQGVDFTLAAAGRTLSGRRPGTRSTGGGGRNAGGSTGRDFLERAFSSIPQAPGVKLGFLRRPDRNNENPNIFTGPRGVTQSAPIRRQTLQGSN